MSHAGPIEQFVAFVRRRVNKHRFWTALVWAAVAGAGLFVAIGLAYVLRGYAVPGGWVLAAFAVAAVAAVGGWLSSRLGEDQSARFIDRFYGLQDSVASYLHFARAGRRDGYYELQAQYTRRQIAGLKPEAIEYQPPRRGLLLAAGLVAVALPIGLRGPSDEVLQRIELEKAVQAATETANKDLKDLVEELDKAVEDPFEKELLDPDKLRKMVETLKAAKDQKEALRQYAQLERDLNRARLAVQRKKDEALLDRAAEKLKEQRETQPLAEQLEQKKYDQAAEQLASMQPKEKLDKSAAEQRKQLARLKAASQRMAAAARANKSTSQGKDSKSGNKSSSKSGAKDSQGGSGSTSESGAASGEGGGELAENLEDLAGAVEDLDESLEEAERQERETGKCDSQCQSECQACQESVNKQLSRLSKNLTKLAIRRNAEKKLSKLCQACSQCQSGLCNSLCQSPNAGGKKAGSSTNTARREARDELLDNGQTTQLKGIKGAGPSLSTVESAEDGSGVSNRRGASRQREFQRQLESFVEREDVPTQVRQGVKNYFQLIHQMESEPATPQQ